MSWKRVLVDDADEPSSVTFGPLELKPFALRAEFHYVESGDDNGNVERRDWLQRLVQVPPPPPALAEWTWEHDQTLRRHSFAYRRLAAYLLDLRFDDADRVREKMLAFESALGRKSSEALTPLECVALGRELERRRRAGDTMARISADLGPSVRTLYRRLDEIERRRA